MTAINCRISPSPAQITNSNSDKPIRGRGWGEGKIRAHFYLRLISNKVLKNSVNKASNVKIEAIENAAA